VSNSVETINTCSQTVHVRRVQLDGISGETIDRDDDEACRHRGWASHIRALTGELAVVESDALSELARRDLVRLIEVARGVAKTQ
jgi:hypothetical protein